MKMVIDFPIERRQDFIARKKWRKIEGSGQAETGLQGGGQRENPQQRQGEEEQKTKFELELKRQMALAKSAAQGARPSVPTPGKPPLTQEEIGRLLERQRRRII